MNSSQTSPPDFSLALGGPLFQLYRRLHLSDDDLRLAGRRTLAVALFAWAPLLAMSLIEGHAWAGVAEPFLLDVGVNARLLVALPLLVGSELFVHRRIRLTVRQFRVRNLVIGTAKDRFDYAEKTAIHARNSVLAEIVMVLLVYAVGVSLVWGQVAHLDVDTWYERLYAGTTHATVAGWWYRFVSLPVFQLILIRWYYRLGIWAWFLWQVSKCELKLVPTHPDRAAGLGFVGESSYALLPFLLAHGTLFAGVIAVGMSFANRTLISYWPTLAMLTALVVAIALAPLLAFTGTLVRTKLLGLLEYGTLAQDYVMAFDRKWLRGGSSRDTQFLGNPDIQSLADLINSYQAVVNMRFMPLSPKMALRLALITLAPVAPLLLTVVPANQLLSMVLKGIF
jgi:hypothetical protein